jgi:MFS family permease
VRSDQDMATDAAIARRGRIVALVIAAGGVAALLAPWLVQALGLPIRYEMLFYFGSLAAFVWALFNIYQMRRARRDNQG